jgi:flagellar motor switch protein FliN
MTEEQVASTTDAQAGVTNQFLPIEESLSESEPIFRSDPKLGDILEERIVDESVKTRISSVPSGSLLQIPISVRVILGTAKMPLSKVMALGPGSIIALDHKLSESVLLMINGNEFARGVVVVVDEKSGQLGISITEILTDTTSSDRAG